MSRRVTLVSLAVFASVVTFAPPAAARQSSAPGPHVAATAPHGAVPARAPDGRLVVVAAEARTPVRVDGALDDTVWREAAPVGHFVQSEPQDGQPATEPTEVRVAYDRTTLYIAADCHDRDPTGGVVNDIRKDFGNTDQDTFEVIIDTFADRRNGFVFMTNRKGARADQQVANEGREINASWDAVWVVRTRQTADGWTVEMAIPFRSLRFDAGVAGLWGINFSRRIRRKNEIDFWSPVTRAHNLARLSLAGDLDGLPALTPGRNLQVKPYVVGRSVRATGAGTVFGTSGDVGLDVKYGVTPSLTLDATVNPDFAQVEADELQVNLTQFSTFYQEKREFFLENSGIFYVGDAARSNNVSTAPTPDEDLLLFHSRRIGLREDGAPLPIFGGGRLTGRAGGVELGLLTMQVRSTDTSPNDNYTVVRARKNVLSGSDVGAIFMSRQSTDASGDYNRVYGVDANIRFFGSTDWNSYVVKTSTPGYTTGQYAFRTSINHEDDFYHGKFGLMSLGDHFNDELGYYRRIGARKWFMDTGIRPRLAALQRHGIREMHPHAVWNYYTDQTGRLIAKKLHTGYRFFFNDGGYTELSVNPVYDQIATPLSLSNRAPAVPAGHYAWTEYQLRFDTDPSRVLSAAFTGITGGLWSGTQRTVQLDLTFLPSYRLKLALGLSRTAAELGVPDSHFVTSLWTLRANYSFSTNMFLDSLIQYNRDKDQINANVRFNVIHRPLSDLFIVYNEQRFTNGLGVTPGRAVIVKFTEMMSF